MAGAPRVVKLSILGEYTRINDSPRTARPATQPAGKSRLFCAKGNRRDPLLPWSRSGTYRNPAWSVAPSRRKERRLFVCPIKGPRTTLSSGSIASVW